MEQEKHNDKQADIKTKDNASLASLIKRSQIIRFMLIIDFALAFLFLLVDPIAYAPKIGTPQQYVAPFILPLFACILSFYLCAVQSRRINKNNLTDLKDGFKIVDKAQTVYLIMVFIILFIVYIYASSTLCAIECDGGDFGRKAAIRSFAGIIGFLAFFLIPIIVKILVKMAKKEFKHD